MSAAAMVSVPEYISKTFELATMSTDL